MLSMDIDMQNENETLIEIAGLRKEITILHVTDSHLAEADEREEEAVRKDAVRRELKNQGYGGPGKDCFSEALRRSNEEGFDCTVFTGDIISFPSQKNLEYIDSKFKELHAPYLYTLGNHDWQFPQLTPSDELRDSMYPQFGKWTNGNPSYQSLDLDGVRIIALDNSNYQINENQVEFVRSQLTANIPTLIFYHIPMDLDSLRPKVLEVWKRPLMVNAQGWDKESQMKLGVRDADLSTQEFHRLITGEESRLIAGLFCGHVHFAHRDPFATGKYQYVTNPGYDRGYRKIIIRPL